MCILTLLVGVFDRLCESVRVYEFITVKKRTGDLPCVDRSLDKNETGVSRYSWVSINNVKCLSAETRFCPVTRKSEQTHTQPSENTYRE